MTKTLATALALALATSGGAATVRAGVGKMTVFPNRSTARTVTLNGTPAVAMLVLTTSSAVVGPPRTLITGCFLNPSGRNFAFRPPPAGFVRVRKR